MRLLFLYIFFWPLTLTAQTETPSLGQRLVESSDEVSRGITRMAERIDLLLAGKKYTNIENQSSAKVTQLLTHSEGGKTRTSTNFGLNLRLPNLEKRWQVRFTSYDEYEENRDLQQRKVRTRAPRTEYGAAIGFFRKLGRVRTTFQPRLLLKDPLEMSYVLRFESSAGDRFRLIPRLELFADPKKGTGEFVSLEFVATLTPKWEVSLQNEEEYRQRGNFFRTSHGLSFDYSIDESRGAGLAFVWSSSSRPRFHLDTFTIAPAFAQEIYRERLRYAISPFILFAKNDHFKGDVGITLQLVITL